MGSTRMGGVIKKPFCLAVLFVVTVIARVFPQEIKVVGTEGSAAVINAGSNFGFRAGGQVRVMRMRNAMWTEISRAKITSVTPDMARIEIIEGSPMVKFKPGDVIVKFSLNPRSKNNLSAAAAQSGYSADAAPQSELQNPRGTYIGPTVDMLLPQGDMKNYFDDTIGYGALLGFRFQNSFDVSIRFMFASQRNEWSMWNIQLLGRVYDANNLFADFGYGICYPSITGSNLAEPKFDPDGNVQLIRMGFVVGGGYPLPISSNKNFEIGFLYHYYPNFGKSAGQFLSIHGRLILKSSF